jgi:hypothetical protein
LREPCLPQPYDVKQLLRGNLAVEILLHAEYGRRPPMTFSLAMSNSLYTPARIVSDSLTPSSVNEPNRLAIARVS